MLLPCLGVPFESFVSVAYNQVDFYEELFPLISGVSRVSDLKFDDSDLRVPGQ